MQKVIKINTYLNHREVSIDKTVSLLPLKIDKILNIARKILHTHLCKLILQEDVEDHDHVHPCTN